MLLLQEILLNQLNNILNELSWNELKQIVFENTFNKIRRLGLVETTELLPLFEHIHPYKNQIENIIAQTKISHNEPKKLKVLKLNRKEKNVVQLHSK